MNSSEDFALLIPAYNPSEGWELLFYDRYLEFCKAIQQNVKVVLINDGSTSDFTKGIDFLKIRIGGNFSYVGYAINKGKGSALKFGAKSSNAKKYMFTDIDFPYSTESMKNVWAAIQSNSGIVIGHRETDYYTDLSLLRTFLSKGLRWLNTLVLNLPVNDTQCGLKAFDHQVKEILLNCQTERFLIDLELLLAVNKKSLNIVPVSSKLRDDINFTKFDSSVLLKEVFSFIRLVWVYRII
ncbi:MAG: glycosyltransferase [Saprospiraceae bacterium]|jgi:glycosyltransferase involved in cell wall biosynthesis|nr:glycosyltransferase [Saprospiraceae bacterium]MBP6567483.1 glycosyltransferase [Saprospiraceae bacterium]